VSFIKCHLRSHLNELTYNFQIIIIFSGMKSLEIPKNYTTNKFLKLLITIRSVIIKKIFHIECPLYASVGTHLRL